jgi:hypothetical protein
MANLLEMVAVAQTWEKRGNVEVRTPESDEARARALGMMARISRYTKMLAEIESDIVPGMGNLKPEAEETFERQHNRRLKKMDELAVEAKERATQWEADGGLPSYKRRMLADLKLDGEDESEE